MEHGTHATFSSTTSTSAGLRACSHLSSCAHTVMEYRCCCLPYNDNLSKYFMDSQFLIFKFGVLRTDSTPFAPVTGTSTSTEVFYCNRITDSLASRCHTSLLHQFIKHLPMYGMLVLVVHLAACTWYQYWSME